MSRRSIAELAADDGGGDSLCDLSRPVKLSAEYLRRLARLEGLPENRTGADKTWILRALEDWREFYARATRVR